MAPITHRTLTTSPALRAYKDDQDRESLKPRAPYGNQASGDDNAAESKDAFDRHNTDPAKSKEKNPEDLDVSGANQEVNKPQGDNPAAEKTATRADRDGSQRSGHGGGNKTKAGRPT